MAGTICVFTFFDEASISWIWRSISSISSRGAGYGRHLTGDPSNSAFWFEVHVDRFLTRQGWGQRSKHLLKRFDELSQMRVEMHALKVLREVSVPLDVALPFFLLFHPPHCFRGQFVLIPFLGTLLGIVE